MRTPFQAVRRRVQQLRAGVLVERRELDLQGAVVAPLVGQQERGLPDFARRIAQLERLRHQLVDRPLEPRAQAIDLLG